MAASMCWVTGLFCRINGIIQTKRNLSVSQTLVQKITDSLWKLGRLNHVAIAVPDLEKAKSVYQNVLGAQVSETVPLPEHGVYTVFVELGNTKLELLHPLGQNSPISGFLQKNKAGGMHHICIEVDDIKEAMSDLKKKTFGF
uniref:Methylmalonyl-CoA epimerase, mitochondrial n=1 Tax=Aquarana catesbeiana TaxID=8400 RepID=C1C4D6_AQUCT|nr:Methylmalonyl-CoA epimerase, mitochondrial precursor [Aquarana catesbeiana]